MKERSVFTLAGCIAAVAIALFFAACSNSSSGGYVPVDPPMTFEQQAEFSFESIKKMHPKMKELWPGDVVLKEENFNLIMVYVSKSDLSDLRMCFINPSEKRELPKDQIDEVLKQAVRDMGSKGYEKFTYKGKNYTLVNYYDSEAIKERQKKAGRTTPRQILIDHLDTFYHESFHFYVQGKDWGCPPGDDRDQIYPIDFKPRTYRILVNVMLFNAFNNFNDTAKRNEYYSKAKYWHEKYKAECADEALQISLNDINEGTANYFGKAVVNSVYPEWDEFEKTIGMYLASDLDGECYSLGSVSLALIRKEGGSKLSDCVASFKGNKNERNSVAVTPVELLLKNVTKPEPYNENQDSATIADINYWQRMIFGELSENGQRIEAAIKYYKASHKTYILDYDDSPGMMGTFKMNESVHPDLEGMTCYLNMVTDGKRSKLEGVTCLEGKFKLPKDNNLDGMPRYLLPVKSVTFVEDAVQPATAPQFGKGTNIDSLGKPDGPKEWLADVKVGKVTAMTPESGYSIELKEYSASAEVYRGKDSSGNTYYIFTELASGSTGGQGRSGE